MTGNYVATDGKVHSLSPIATFSDGNFSARSLESRHLPFPALQPLAWANAQVCALSAEVSPQIYSLLSLYSVF